MKLSVFIAQIVLLVAPLQLDAQSLGRFAITTAGNISENGGYYLNHTVGEAFTGTEFANFHFLTQGYQQPSLINQNDPPSYRESLDAIDVYPNPVSSQVDDLLTVSFRVKELTHYFINVYDVRGSRIMNYSLENMSSQDVQLDFSSFGQGIYFVHVYSSNRKMDRHFKIEKF
jgi:hypothetical protein